MAYCTQRPPRAAGFSLRFLVSFSLVRLGSRFSLRALVCYPFQQAVLVRTVM